MVEMQVQLCRKPRIQYCFTFFLGQKTNLRKVDYSKLDFEERR